MLAYGYGEGLVVEGVFLFDCAGKWIVGDDGGADAGDVEVDVLQVFDLVVERGLADEAVDGEGAVADGDGDSFGRLDFDGMEFLAILVVSEIVFGLHDGLVLRVEERVSFFVALLFDGRVEHELAVGILALLSFFVEHGGGRQLDDRGGASVGLLAFLTF